MRDIVNKSSLDWQNYVDHPNKLLKLLFWVQVDTQYQNFYLKMYLPIFSWWMYKNKNHCVNQSYCRYFKFFITQKVTISKLLMTMHTIILWKKKISNNFHQLSLILQAIIKRNKFHLSNFYRMSSSKSVALCWMKKMEECWFLTF